MIKDITLRRLQEVNVKGSFSINCHNEEMYSHVLDFFYNPKATKVLRFKDIPALEAFHKRLEEDSKMNAFINKYVDPMKRVIFPVITRSYADVRAFPPFKFTIKYETLNELLKLREIFNIRANKFDTYLIEKRGYNPFTADFYSKCADKTIYKVKK
jgi:hypothetical protein